MSVLEMQSPSRPAVRWTEVCATEHGSPVTTRVRARAESARGPAIRTLDRGRPVPTRSIGPGRTALVRPASTGQVTACRVASKPVSPVVDDVPTWVLLACGILFGVVMLLALALLGGPAYA